VDHRHRRTETAPGTRPGRAVTILTTWQAAALFGVPVYVIQRWIVDGTLPSMERSEVERLEMLTRSGLVTVSMPCRRKLGGAGSPWWVGG
jgi:hypothetical protein